MKFSIIIPIFNRPDELQELLESFEKQTYTDFEVIIVEDGSMLKCEDISNNFSKVLNIKYFYKNNEGQGFARNFGAKHAIGTYLVFFDSDVIVPKDYFKTLDEITRTKEIESFGGRDLASPDFTDFQKAISYSMTGFLTTGGIRNKGANLGGNFQLRSFNMGLKKTIFESIGGFKKTNMGEDMELNNRLENQNYKKEFIETLGVFHKRRGTFKSFFKQVYSFGQTRVQLKREFNIPIKVVHLFPVIFFLFIISIPISFLFYHSIFRFSLFILTLYLALIFILSSLQNKSIKVGILSIPAAFIQLFSYGMGFIMEIFKSKNSA
jgi:glycosyltransferase involved in cell wall biosynthesis